MVFTARDGRRTRMENVFLRGTQVRLALLPDILQSAPMFKKLAEAAKPAAPSFPKAKMHCSQWH